MAYLTIHKRGQLVEEVWYPSLPQARAQAWAYAQASRYLEGSTIEQRFDDPIILDRYLLRYPDGSGATVDVDPRSTP